jgi:hypothetical protein
MVQQIDTHVHDEPDGWCARQDQDHGEIDINFYESLSSIFEQNNHRDRDGDVQRSVAVASSRSRNSSFTSCCSGDADLAKGTLNVVCGCNNRNKVPALLASTTDLVSSSKCCVTCTSDDHDHTTSDRSPQSSVVDLNAYLSAGANTGTGTTKYYKNRFQFCQYNRTLHHPSLPQPEEDTTRTGISRGTNHDATAAADESTWSRPNGFRFLITADTQFGILMDGFDMEEPDWKTEIEISRQTVHTINNMKGEERPLFVCVCGDLVDTESSFTFALAAWKVVHPEWERSAIFNQQLKDWKEVWSRVDDDIALVCCCGNHDVGNRPSAKSIQTWTSAFGDDYLAFWANGTYHITLNNCLFYDPSNAQDLFDEQLEWLADRLSYAHKKQAQHIFVHSHFPWFLTHEEETDEETMGSSFAPEGWGTPEGTQFADFYFRIPLERRRVAMELFKKYHVTACFSGHFHQNLEAKSSWGMDMIVTGPLSMPLQRLCLHKDQDDGGGGRRSPHTHTAMMGIRAVDVTKDGFTHKFIPLELEESKANLLRRPAFSL